MNNYIPPIVKNLLIINVLFFIATYLLKSSIDMQSIFSVYYFNSHNFRIWQPITYMFMHFDFMHILFNMFALYSFGSVLENQWGAKRFINFYLITGLGALGMQWCVQAIEIFQMTGMVMFPGGLDMELVNRLYNEGQITLQQGQTLAGLSEGPMMGASGAVFGLLIAFGMMYPNAELYIMFIPVPVKAKYIMPVYVLISLFLGLAKIQGDSVAHYAHLGGALLGFILVKLWKKKDRFYDYYE